MISNFMNQCLSFAPLLVATTISLSCAPPDVEVDVGGDSEGEGEGENIGSEGEGEDSTVSILVYIESAHAQMRTNFSAQEDRLSADLSASGGLNGGNHITRSIDENLSAGLGAFLQAVVDYSSSRQFDASQVRTALEQRRSSDLSFFASYYQSVNWITRESARESAVSTAQDVVNARYGAAIAGIP